jgi:hypothetical protein
LWIDRDLYAAYLRQLAGIAGDAPDPPADVDCDRSGVIPRQAAGNNPAVEPGNQVPPLLHRPPSRRPRKQDAGTHDEDTHAPQVQPNLDGSIRQ